MAMLLKMTDLELQLITDPNIYLLFENAIRRVVSTVSNRYSKANNKYMSDYDSSQPSSYIMSLDVVNLYDYCMSFKLPCGNFDSSMNLSLIHISEPTRPY